MIRTGDTVVNPVTGEQLTFVKTARDTDGEAVVVECVVQPDGFVASAHFHPYQTERFQVRAPRARRLRPAGGIAPLSLVH